MKRLLAVFGLLIACLPVWAEPQYFVVLGSYSSLAHAEEAKEQAAVKLPEPYSVVPADTARGLFYRVLAGPYLGKERANGMLEKARANDFSDAWLLAEQAPVGSSYAAASEAADLAPLETEDFEDRLLSAGGGSYDAPPASPGPADLAEPRAETDDFEPPVLIDEAPPGYDLHRLRRTLPQ